MNAPDKIYLSVIPESHGQYNDIYEKWSLSPINGAENTEYIRKDLVDEKIKTAEETIELAEDHAYFAGKEKLREELLEWANAKKAELLDDEEITDVAVGINMGMDMLISKLNSL